MKLEKAIPYEIRITPSDNMGFLVRIGCGTFTAENRTNLLAMLSEYLQNPKGLEEKYNKSCTEEVPDSTDPTCRLKYFFKGATNEPISNG